MNTTSEDNIYPAGTFIRAKVDPALPLVISRYYQRIYYCAVVGKPDHKHYAYFGHELTPPSTKQ